jgi:hypothetical protein
MEWGKWSYDPNARVVQFANRAALDQYNTFVAGINQAG